MEKRNDGEHGFAPRLEARHPAGALHGVDEQIAMRQHRAFGYTGRAAGILQHRDMALRNNVDRCHKVRGFKQRVERDMVAVMRRVGDILRFGCHKQGALGHRHRFTKIADDDFAKRAIANKRHQLVIRRPQIHRRNQLDIGILQLMRNFMAGIEWVEIDDGATRFQNRVIQHHVLRAIGHEQTDPRALHHPDTLQATRHPVGHFHQLGVAVGFTKKIERDILRPTLRGILEQAVQRPGMKALIPRNPIRVMGLPGLCVRHSGFSSP